MKKFSKQRELILNTILENRVHPTADFIYDYLKKDNPNLSLGTVYRNLSQLTEHGVVRKVSIPGQPDRFDSNLHDHYHLVCEMCNEVYDVESSILNSLSSELNKELGIEIKHKNISFNGICKHCKEKTSH